MITLAGKRIFVTGAAAGIGRAISEVSAAAGAEVLATDIDEAALAEVAATRIRTRALDVTDIDAIKSLFADEAPFTGVVNTAGYVFHGTTTETSDEAWHRSFKINSDSVFYVIREALPGMIANGGGSIVNIASLASSIKGFPWRAAYAASKSSVIGLTKSVAVDYMADGIRCHAICPGTIDTPSLQARIRSREDEFGSYEKAREYFDNRQAMGRLGTPDEIAKFVLYLLSDDGTYATGQAYIIDGGTVA